MKLDFITKLEEVMVPKLMSKNILLVMIYGNKLLCMIDGLVKFADKNLVSAKDTDNKQSMQAFNGWMKRFIVTNYEIFLDHFKTHSDFVAQKYFNKPFVNE